MPTGWLTFYLLILGGTGLSDDVLMQEVAQLIRNDTRELPTGTDYLCTEVSFKGKEKSLTMIVHQNYFVRKTKRVAMTETRFVPLGGVQKVVVLEDKAHPQWERRFMVLIQYVASGRSVDTYGPVAGGNKKFGEVQAFTLGTYSLARAQQVVSGLKTLCDSLTKNND